MTTLSSPIPLDTSSVYSAPLEPLPRRSHIARLGRPILYFILSLFCLIVVLILVFHAYIAYALAYPTVAPLSSNPMLAKKLAYSDVTFASADHKSTVNGWWIPVEASRSTVVLSHGYGANREERWVPMYDLAELLHRLKYNVLMFDYGFADKTYKNPATGGLHESQQLLGALQFAREQGSETLVVWGFSMGAGTALQAALQSELINAMILDSTFLPDEDTLYYNIRMKADVPKYPSVSLIRHFFPFITGARLEQIPSAQIQNTAFDFPMLLIHGTADNKAPTYLSENVAKAQTHALSELWIVPEALHELIYRKHKKEYVARITSFLNQIQPVGFVGGSIIIHE